MASPIRRVAVTSGAGRRLPTDYFEPGGVNTSTESVTVRLSRGSSAPTPTTLRATSSPRSLRIDNHHRVFPRVGALGIAKRAFDSQRGERLLGPALDGRIGIESQMMMATRADAGALQDRCLAVRTDPGLAGRPNTDVHVFVSAWASRPSRIPPCRACANLPPR